MATDQELVKSLTSLIDETLSEIEDLKKSRYSAAEASIGDKDSGMSGMAKDGEMGKKEDEEDEEEEESAEKAEGKNSEADPGQRGVTAPAEASIPPKSSLHQEAAKSDDEDDEDDEDKKKKKEEAAKAEGKNSEADPGKRGVTAPAEASVPPKSNLQKSQEESDELLKSYVDEKFESLEKRLSAILDTVKEIGDAPVAPKGVPAGITALAKSADEVKETLSKSQVASKLFDLKKSGTYVDTADIASVEMGGDHQAIIEKYNLN